MPPLPPVTSLLRRADTYGINTNWDFESDLVQYWAKTAPVDGDTIHAFDPSIDGAANPDTEHITFHRDILGEGDKNPIGWTQALGHKKEGCDTLAVFKADAEGAEWPGLAGLDLTNRRWNQGKSRAILPLGKCHFPWLDQGQSLGVASS